MTDETNPIPEGVEAVRAALLDSIEPRSTSQGGPVQTFVRDDLPEAQPAALTPRPGFTYAAIAVCLLGAAAGVAPQILNGAPRPPPIPSSAHSLQIVTVEPAQPKLPPVTEKLEVLPAITTGEARQPQFEPPAVPLAPQPHQVDEARTNTARQAAMLPASLPSPRIRSVVTPGPAFDCDGRRSFAEDMVCTDAGLADADRAMAAAYRRAARAGVPMGLLEDGHDQWVQAREDAAHEGRGEMSDVYAGRIAELLELGDRGRRF